MAETVTGPDGRYTFPGFPAGAYSVAVNRPNADGSRTTTVRALSVQAGVAIDASFAGAMANGSIAGNVFTDLLDTGLFSAGDSGLGGWTVARNGTDLLGRTLSRGMTTDPSVAYALSGLMAGSYAVAITTSAGFLADKASPTTQVATLAAGGTASLPFGLLPPASLAGVVYLDANNTGVMDGTDLGIANVAVTLAGTNDLGQAVIAQTITDADGQYTFGALRPGSYAVTRGRSPAFADGPSNVYASRRFPA